MTLAMRPAPERAAVPNAGLRIAQVTEYYYPHLGGICEHVHFLSGELRRRGMHVDIITPRIGAAPAPPGVIHVGRSLPVPWNGSHARVSYARRLTRELLAVLRAGRYDIVHVHSPLTPSLPLVAFAHEGAALVGTWHTQFSRSLPFRLFRKELQRRVDRLDAAIAVSPTARAAIARYFDADWQVVPNGVDTTLFRPHRPAPPEMRDGAPTVLFVGRLDPRNGLSVLLAAWPALKARVPAARLVIVGDGPLRRWYAHRARRLADVDFVGALGAARADYYANATVYACPTSRASFGITLLEAMASGCPIACSDIPGFSDVVRHGREALTFPVGDAAAMADTLATLLERPLLRRALGATGLRRAARYDWRRVTDEVLDAYRRAMAMRLAAA